MYMSDVATAASNRRHDVHNTYYVDMKKWICRCVAKEQMLKFDFVLYAKFWRTLKWIPLDSVRLISIYGWICKGKKVRGRIYQKLAKIICYWITLTFWCAKKKNKSIFSRRLNVFSTWLPTVCADTFFSLINLLQIGRTLPLLCAFFLHWCAERNAIKLQTQSLQNENSAKECFYHFKFNGIQWR